MATRCKRSLSRSRIGAQQVNCCAQPWISRTGGAVGSPAETKAISVPSVEVAKDVVTVRLPAGSLDREPPTCIGGVPRDLPSSRFSRPRRWEAPAGHGTAQPSRHAQGSTGPVLSRGYSGALRSCRYPSRQAERCPPANRIHRAPDGRHIKGTNGMTDRFANLAPIGRALPRPHLHHGGGFRRSPATRARRATWR